MSTNWHDEPSPAWTMAEQTERALVPGQMLAGKYRVESRLDGGGYADIYLAHRIHDELPVAIKALRLDATHGDPAAADRFVREAAIASHLMHPNLVKILDFGQSRALVLYMVMERLRGKPLSSTIHQSPMPPDRVVSILRQLLDALVHAHGQATIHRDLKPSNVYLCAVDAPHSVGPRDRVKILDFGFAKGLAKAGAAIRATLTLEGATVGTPGYVAPELLQKGGVLTPRVDLYAVGILGHEMLTARQAFAGEGIERAALQVQHDPPPLPPAVAQHPVCAVIQRLHARRPEQRYPSAAAALRALQSLRVH